MIMTRGDADPSGMEPPKIRRSGPRRSAMRRQHFKKAVAELQGRLFPGDVRPCCRTIVVLQTAMGKQLLQVVGPGDRRPICGVVARLQQRCDVVGFRAMFGRFAELL